MSGPAETSSGPGTEPAHALGPDELVAPTARLLLPAGAPEGAWHEARRGGIGGSDVAAILGMDRYRGPLHVWEAKQGRAEHTDSEAAKWGRRLEGLIAEGFAEETGYVIADPPGTLVHVGLPWARANLDRLVIEPEPDGTGTTVIAPLECKNRSEYQAADWADAVPDGPALQAHWYMAVTGYTHAWVAALIGGNRLRWHRLERDQELTEHLLTFCGQWWQRHVVDGVPPDPDGSAATTDLLARLWDVEPKATAEVDAAETLLLAQRRTDLKARAAALDMDLAAVENRLKARLGQAEVGTIGGRLAYSWKANGTFSAARFREEQPELAALYVRLVEAVDTEGLAYDHPVIYRRYRARVLRVPKKGPLS